MMVRHSLFATVLSARAQLAAVAFAGLVLPACAAQNLQDYVRDGERPYQSTCLKQAADLNQAVASRRYLQPMFHAHTWTTEPAPNGDQRIHENAVLKALRDGRVKTLFVQARGGIGKTEFSKALRAAECEQVPTFLLDFKDIAKAGGTEQAIINLIATQLQAAPGDDFKLLQNFLGKERFILVVDALDEVTPAQRTPVLQAIRGFRAQMPAAQLVLLGRPAVHEPYYGLTEMDALLELDPLDCTRAMSALGLYVKDIDESKRVSAFIKSWGLDKEGRSGDRCYHPFLSTYRDLQAVTRMAEKFDPKQDEMGGIQFSTSQVHETILAERVKKELGELGMVPEDMFGAVDKILNKDGFEDGEWNLAFTIKRCLDAQPGGDSSRNRQLCEELFQSVLFERIGGNMGALSAAEWKFGNQGQADLFTARWLDSELGKAGDNCAMLDAHSVMFDGSKEVAGYLVGRPHGGKCVAKVAQLLCKAKPDQKKNHVRQIYRGLPPGDARRPLVSAAKEAAAKSTPDGCTVDVLGAL
jgi:hypothetical protein